MPNLRTIVANQFKGLSRFQGAYYGAFLLALLLCLSPSNVLGYVAPIFVLVVVLIFGRSFTLLRNLIIWLAVWLALITVQAILSPRFAWNSAVISMVTYSAFAVIICIPTKELPNILLHDRIMFWVRMAVVIEAIIGIVQAIYGFSITGKFGGSNGDFVEGTIHPWLEAELSFSNPIFAANMTLMLLALVPMLITQRKGLISVILGSMALIMASVVHMLFFVAAALAISFLIFRPISIKDKTFYVLMVGAALISIASVLFMWSSFIPLRDYIDLFTSGRAYKVQAAIHVVRDLPEEYPLISVIGIGPGQYSSRAGLIGTGLYFGSPMNPRSIPLMPTGMSEAFEANILERWLTIAEQEWQGIRVGSTYKPFYSWLSVFAEFGALGLILIFGGSAYALWRIKKSAQDIQKSIAATFIGASILFVLFLGFQENYWEVPQAVLIGFMLIQLNYALLVHSPRHEPLVELSKPATNSTA